MLFRSSIKVLASGGAAMPASVARGLRVAGFPAGGLTGLKALLLEVDSPPSDNVVPHFGHTRVAVGETVPQFGQSTSPAMSDDIQPQSSCCRPNSTRTGRAQLADG